MENLTIIAVLDPVQDTLYEDYNMTYIEWIRMIFRNRTREQEINPILDQFKFVLKKMRVYYTPTVASVGIFCNCIAWMVLLKSKLRHTSGSHYLAATVIANTLHLLGLFVQWLTIFDLDLYNTPGWCQFISFVNSVSTFLSIWLVVAFAVDRFIAVCRPELMTSLGTTFRAKCVIIGLVLVGAVVYMNISLTVGVINLRGKPRCSPLQKFLRNLRILTVFDIIVNIILPYATILALSGLIARRAILDRLGRRVSGRRRRTRAWIRAASAATEGVVVTPPGGSSGSTACGGDSGFDASPTGGCSISLVENGGPPASLTPMTAAAPTASTVTTPLSDGAPPAADHRACQCGPGVDCACQPLTSNNNNNNNEPPGDRALPAGRTHPVQLPLFAQTLGLKPCTATHRTKDSMLKLTLCFLLVFCVSHLPSEVFRIVHTTRGLFDEDYMVHRAEYYSQVAAQHLFNTSLATHLLLFTLCHEGFSRSVARIAARTAGKIIVLLACALHGKVSPPDEISVTPNESGATTVTYV